MLNPLPVNGEGAGGGVIRYILIFPEGLDPPAPRQLGPQIQHRRVGRQGVERGARGQPLQRQVERARQVGLDGQPLRLNAGVLQAHCHIGGVAVIGGTNGKTTTARMLAAILGDDGRRVLHNRAGANLVSGLTATALAGSSLAGQVRADMGLFETDEAALQQ